MALLWYPCGYCSRCLDWCKHPVLMPGARGVRFDLKLGQIDLKWDKSGTFSRSDFSDSQRVLKYFLEKSRIVSFWANLTHFEPKYDNCNTWLPQILATLEVNTTSLCQHSSLTSQRSLIDMLGLPVTSQRSLTDLLTVHTVVQGRENMTSMSQEVGGRCTGVTRLHYLSDEILTWEVSPVFYNFSYTWTLTSGTARDGIFCFKWKKILGHF